MEESLYPTFPSELSSQFNIVGSPPSGVGFTAKG
jgi:hypothetical protein